MSAAITAKIVAACVLVSGFLLGGVLSAAWGANLLAEPEILLAGQWRLTGRATYAPYFLTLLDGQPQAKDCPPPAKQTAADRQRCSSSIRRPVESRHWAEISTMLETGLGQGVGLALSAPLAMVVQYAQNPAELPPGIVPWNLAFGDFSIMLHREIAAIPQTHMRISLQGNVPPMGTPLGNEWYLCPEKDAQGKDRVADSGKLILREYVVFPAAPSVDLAIAVSRALLSRILTFYSNAGVNFPFRRVAPEPVVTWRGLRYTWNGGVEYRPFFWLDLQLEALGTWSNPAEQDRCKVCMTGYGRLDIAPGIAWRMTKSLKLRGALALPIWQTGYQRDFPFVTGIIGMVVDL
ncbi:MAG: hypothetical protein HY692_02610 [Cyanobacteria bacterium NC_groundwater_1444_Ag_S-0.65um_54_12]|nr:hypothetical protein [Cyanobacteria bacterium NC_groundwater_1444_Ag_S-0.65um_54_12]